MRLNWSFERVTSAISSKVKAACSAPQHFQVQKNKYSAHASIFLGVIFIQRRLTANFQCDCLHQKFIPFQNDVFMGAEFL